MKRLIPSSLITFLQENPNCVRADLFTISLPNGSAIYATSGQFDITIPSGTNGWAYSTTTFHANQFGVWERGAITSEASFDLNSNTMQLTCIPQQSTAYPGLSIGILSAALNSLFDAAQVTVQTVYMPLGNYGNVSAGVETKFVGQITKIDDISRNKVVFECADYLYLLNLKVPTRLIQSNCPWSFADANCALTASTFTTNFTAATGTTKWAMTPGTPFTAPAGYFTQGVVKCTTGTNAGLSQTVKLHDSSGHLQLTFPWLIQPSLGDTFSVIAGCDKSVTTCNQKFSNQIHFGGQPFVPVPSASV
jgi:uncharacterized phage protein (TIGR02218 family)